MIPKPPKCLYYHVLDTTEGIPGNRPMTCLTTTKANPFGKPGVDYSETFRWTFHRYAPAGQAQPMTEADILSVLSRLPGIPPQAKRMPPGWLMFARAVEAFHGIGAIKSNGDGK